MDGTIIPVFVVSACGCSAGREQHELWNKKTMDKLAVDRRQPGPSLFDHVS
jgi:hypothetical protein